MRVAEAWRLKGQRYTLEAATNTIGQIEFPPRPVTPREVKRFEFSNEPIAIPKDDLRAALKVGK